MKSYGSIRNQAEMSESKYNSPKSDGTFHELTPLSVRNRAEPQLEATVRKRTEPV